ncbi:MAG TPA: T9SS type A sorting domain-containing protein [Ignavibacteriaceae bacterium]|nr:T9SS type A sorting domain-containing protein [Ignavibacteriaceae bacterium]
MQKSFNILSVSILTVFFLLVQFIFTPNLTFCQELNWTHTGGPMGGIIGGMDINSNGDIYAGVYPFMIAYTGLYKSTDNGDTWNRVETQFEDFEVFSVHITTEDHIWVGTDYQGKLYRSTDNGQTWENKANGYYAFECWAIGESKDGVLFAGDANSGQLYRSTDNGESWQFSALIAPLTFAVDSNNVVYTGTFNGLYSSTDNGLTWTQNNFFSGYAVSTVQIDTSNGIYCGTGYTYLNGDGLFHSGDGGQTWRQLGFAGKEVLALAFDSEWNLFAGTKEDGLFKTTDLGQSWTQYQNGIYRKEVFKLVINKQDDIFIGSEGGGTGWYLYGGGGVFRSTNGGELFEQVGLPISLVKNIVFSGDSLIITSTPSGVQKYNRFTKKWNNIGLHNVEAVAITPSKYLYAATRDDGLYKSTDLGESWILTNLTIDTLMPVYNVLVVSDDTVFVSTGFGFNLRRSTNGGQNWNILPIITGETYRGLFLSNKNCYVSGFGSGTQILYKSTDYGNSFDSLYAGFDSFDFNNAISVTTNEFVFIASRGNILNGIIRSTNGGITWENLLSNTRTATVFTDNTGMVITGSLVVSSSDTNKIFISTNFGDDWTSTVQPTNYGIFITDIKEKRNKYFFGTSGEGLFEVDKIMDVQEKSNFSNNYYLFQNYPNPFNPTTIILYAVSSMQFVTLKVYDMLGNEIASLVKEEKQPGTYEVEFDGTDLSSGIYFYQMKAGGFMQTKKMIILK